MTTDSTTPPVSEENFAVVPIRLRNDTFLNFYRSGSTAATGEVIVDSSTGALRVGYSSDPYGEVAYLPSVSDALIIRDLRMSATVIARFSSASIYGGTFSQCLANATPFAAVIAYPDDGMHPQVFPMDTLPLDDKTPWGIAFNARADGDGYLLDLLFHGRGKVAHLDDVPGAFYTDRASRYAYTVAGTCGALVFGDPGLTDGTQFFIGTNVVGWMFIGCRIPFYDA